MWEYALPWAKPFLSYHNRNYGDLVSWKQINSPYIDTCLYWKLIYATVSFEYLWGNIDGGVSGDPCGRTQFDPFNPLKKSIPSLLKT